MREVAGAERTGREQRAQAKLREMSVLDKAGLYQQLSCVHRASTTLSARLIGAANGKRTGLELSSKYFLRQALASQVHSRRLRIYFKS